MCVECGCEEAEEQQCAVPQTVQLMAANANGEVAEADEQSRQVIAEREPRPQLEVVAVQP
jgi:hypothetical protein